MFTHPWQKHFSIQWLGFYNKIEVGQSKSQHPNYWQILIFGNRLNLVMLIKMPHPHERHIITRHIITRVT